MNACKESVYDVPEDVTMDDVAPFVNSDYAMSLSKIYKHVEKMCKGDNGQDAAHVQARKYYRDKKPFIWLGKDGLCEEANQLIEVLNGVEDEGLSKNAFRVGQIEKDAERMRLLDFDKKNPVNEVVARLEYNLTRAYFKYAAGEHYGFVNPTAALNKIQLVGKDTVKVKTRLFDMNLEHPNDLFFDKAVASVQSGNFTQFLDSLKPQTDYYRKMAGELKNAKSAEYRKKVLVNMERARWRLADPIEKHDKYVLVNVAAQHLFAVAPNSSLTMKVCCGAQSTKTPLLNSYIKKMDLNPVWRMPYSIIKGIAGRAGSSSYFNSRRYSIYDGAGRKVDPSRVTREQLLSGRYSVVQAAGKGNSLGKIIFRFDNNFAVYLHHTNSPWVFEQQNRCVSHGCIRLEKPFDLAVFLLGEDNTDKIEKVKYSMDNGPQNDSIPSDKYIKECKVSPEVPVYLTYYTIYPDLSHVMKEYNDVYGYDKILYHELSPILK